MIIRDFRVLLIPKNQKHVSKTVTDQACDQNNQTEILNNNNNKKHETQNVVEARI